jgi:hypothetical protein
MVKKFISEISNNFAFIRHFLQVTTSFRKTQILYKLVNLCEHRLVTIQLLLPATVKVGDGGFGQTVTSIQSFGEGQFSLTQLEF